MRIGIVYQHGVPNVAYRVIGPAEALARQGHDLTSVELRADHGFESRQLYACDVVHIYRRADETVRRCAMDLQQRGVAVTWDNDDDIRLMPDERRRQTRMTRLDTDRAFQAETKMIRLADVVTTTSGYLADCFREGGAAHVMQIGNFLLPTQYAAPARHRDRIIIGWVAGMEHIADARALAISDLLTRVLERHPRVRVVTIGVRLNLDPSRYEHHAEIRWRELRDHIRRFDIALAPLADIPMSYARSNVKVKEYAAAGVPWLASARGPYVDLGAREGGWLVEDDGWDEALNRLIGSRLTRWRLGRRAAQWAAGESIDRRAGEWLAAFNEAIARRQDAAGNALGRAAGQSI